MIVNDSIPALALAQTLRQVRNAFGPSRRPPAGKCFTRTLQVKTKIR